MNAKKVIFTGQGNLDKIKVTDFEVTPPGEKEVQVRVDYSGLAYADIMLRKFKMPGLPSPPFTPGADIAGVISSTGSGVKELKKGDRVVVLLMSSFGGQTEYINVPAEKAQIIPDDIPSDKAVCMMVNYLTAYQMMNNLQLFNNSQPGTLLVHGGSGGVGSALIQLAVSHGHRVITTVSDRNREMVKLMGATAIDYRKTDFATEIQKMKTPIDYAFDCIGGNYMRRSLKVLKKGGIYTGFGFQNNLSKGMLGFIQTMLSFTFRKAFTWRKTLLMFQLRDTDPALYKKDIEALFNLYRNKRIDPLISEIIPLGNAAEAHGKLERGERRGKILLQPIPQT